MVVSHANSVRVFAAFLAIITLLTCGFGVGGSASAATQSDSMIRESLDDIVNLITSETYADYLQKYSSGKDCTSPLTVDILNYVTENADAVTTATVQKVDELFKDENGNAMSGVLFMSDDGNVVFKVNVPEDAFYSMKVTYYTGNVYSYHCAKCGKTEILLERREIKEDSTCVYCSTVNKDGKVITETYSKSAEAERSVLIDTKVPYKEARSVEFSRIWADVYTYGDGSTLQSNTSEFVDKANKDEDRIFAQDSKGNEAKPDKKLIAEWNTEYLCDSTGYYDEPLKFYLTKGEHLITFAAIREPIAISSFVLDSYEGVASYEEYLNLHKDAKDVDEKTSAKIQAEYSVLTSGKTIYQLNDRTSVASEPQDASRIRYNQIGGDKWQYVGQWIEWEVDIPETGYYAIIPRSKQDIYAGVYVSRKIYINGELPFAEANSLRFNYSTDWQTEALNDGEKTFKFYLEKGLNKIRMEVVLGDMANILSTIEASLNTINGYYRKIIMVTGPSPDQYRDYGFARSMPDVVKGLKAQADLLSAISEQLVEIIGYAGDHSVILNKTAFVLEEMGTKPTKIATKLGELKTQIGALGTWLTSTQNQPLDIDYIVFQAPDKKAPKAEAGFFETLWGEIVRFITSFFADYTSIGSMKDGEVAADLGEVVVWTFTSRDQSQIIKNLVDDDFTEKYPGISVEVKLVVADTLLPATLAGTGPDVALNIAQSTPINYAIRSAVKSLNHLDGDTEIGYNFTASGLKAYANDPEYKAYVDSGILADYVNLDLTKLTEDTTEHNVDHFAAVADRFADQALVPFTLYGETYAIPETMSFSMLFYRKDIFAELGITVPETWDEFMDIIYTLQANNLDIGFPTGVTGSTLWMYQNGVTMYDEGNYQEYIEKYPELGEVGNVYYLRDENTGLYKGDTNGNGVQDAGETFTALPKTDGMTINLDDDKSLSCFKDVCEFFTMYSFPVSYDFANRFRSGEMPLAVADYTAYNQLIVFAPEINGLWGFTTLPGFQDELTGEINNTTVGTVTGMVMMRGVDEQSALNAWIFMQWWSNADIQSSYGNEIEALLGPSAKYSTANLEALYDMPWSKSEYDNLYAQFNAVTCTPEYPGGYIITRYASFAFLAVYNDGNAPVDELNSYMVSINSELTRKRKEFGLPTADKYHLDD